jgi:haloalkane dehalogenase
VSERPDWFPGELFPVASHFVAAGPVRVHYVDEGRGPVLLLLHGNPTWSFLYRHLIRELAGEFRCVAPDFPGFGLSKAPPAYDFRPASHADVLREFVRALDLRNAVMMVQDWSGPIGLSVAVRELSRFDGLVIGNTWAWSGKGDPHYERFSSLMGGGLVGFLNRHFNFFTRFVMRGGMRLRKPSAEVMSAYLAPFSEPGSRVATHIFAREIIGSSDFLEALERNLPKLASRPALIVWGDRDFAFRKKELRRFESVFPDHRTVELAGSGHLIQEDAPEEIARAIRAWRRDSDPWARARISKETT